MSLEARRLDLYRYIKLVRGIRIKGRISSPFVPNILRAAQRRLFYGTEILGVIHRSPEVDLINLDVFAYLERRVVVLGAAHDKQDI